MEQGHSNQDSLRSTAKALLECLDRYDNHGRLNSVIDRMTRICLAEILASGQPEVEHDGSCKYNDVDLQTIFGVKIQTPVAHDEVIHPPSTDLPLLPQPPILQNLQGQLPGQENSFLSQGSVMATSTSPEGINPPPEQCLPDYFPFGTPYPISYEPSVRPFHSSVHQHSTYAEGQMPSDPSTSRHQELHLPVTREGQEKMQCRWAGCSSVITKGSLKRHMNEIHLKIRYTCIRCGREFQRRHDKNKHERTCYSRQFQG